MDAYKNKLERYNYTIWSNNYINVIIYFENQNMQYPLIIGTFILICYLLYKHGLKNLIILFK